MASKTWSPVDGDWSNPANWGGSVPVTGDDVTLKDSSQSITTGLDQKTVNLASLNIESSFTGDVGNSGASLQIGATNVRMNGTGDVYLDASTGAFNYDNVVLLGTVVNKQLYLAGDVVMAVLKSGNITFQSGSITDIYAEKGTSVSSNPSVTVENATVANFYSMGNTALTLDGSGTITTYEGESGTFAIVNGTVTNINGHGSTITWTAIGTISSVKMYAGTFDASTDGRAKTITTLHLHEDSIVDLDNGMANIDVTNPVKWFGGAFTPGASVTIESPTA